MRIFALELKKLFRPGILLFVLAFCTVYFLQFFSEYCGFPYTGLRSGQLDLNEYPMYLVLTRLHAEYGPTLEPEEAADAEKYMEEYGHALDPYVAGKPEYEAKGITSGMGLWQYSQQKGEFDLGRHLTKEEQDACRELTAPFEFSGEYAKVGNYAFMQMNALDVVLVSYEMNNRAEHIEYMENLFDRRISARFLEAVETKEYTNLFFRAVSRETDGYFSHAAVLVLLSVWILLIPYMARDRMSGVLSLQATGRSGRKTLRTQAAAAVFGGVLLAAVLTAVLTLVFIATNEFGVFFTQRVGTFTMANELPWVDMRYPALLGGRLLVLLLFAAAGSLAFFMLSFYSRDYVSALAKSLPVLAALAFTSYHCMVGGLTTFNSVYFLFRVPFIEPILAAVLLLLAAVLLIICLRLHKKAGL